MNKALFVILSLVMIIAGTVGAVSCSSYSATTQPGIAQTSPPPGGTTGPDFKPAAVSIEGFAFAPASLTVAIGTTVTWTNNDSVAHTVTSDTGVFDSKNMAKGATFSYTFNAKGTFAYHCSIHSSMKGTVIVQ